VQGARSERRARRCPLSQRARPSVRRTREDSTQPITIQGNLTVSQSGQFSIGRDENGSLTVGDSPAVDSGGQLLVGRNLNNLTVGGNLIIGPSGSGIAVNCAINGLAVNGYFQRQGGTANPVDHPPGASA
jgi:hypothetical protein